MIGAYFSHGPLAGAFRFASWASLPQSRSKQPRKSVVEREKEHGLSPEEVGVIDSEVFLAFVWTVAGRTATASADWRRERPLIVVLDNYSVHKSARVKEELPALTAADIHFFYLPAYSPELSRIESLWQDVKYRELTERSQAQLASLKQAVDLALARKAIQLRQTVQSLHRTA